MCTPPSSVSRVATRVMISSGASHRTASSIACDSSDAVGAHGVELIRVGQQPEQQVAQRAVGGLHPGGQQQTAGRKRFPRRTSFSPSISAAARPLMRSSRGSARRAARIGMK